MSGTKIGGLKSAAKNKKLYGDDFYVERGKNGGKASKGGGFTKNAAFALEMGIKAASARGFKVKPETYERLAVLQAEQAVINEKAANDSLARTYGVIRPPDEVEVVSIPTIYYMIWIFGTAIAVFVSFFLGSITYR